MRALAGTGGLVRLALRLDRVRLPVWVLALGATVLVTPPYYRSLLRTVASPRQLVPGLADNPGLAALQGRLPADPSVGALTAWKTGVFVAALAALMSALTVLRHTRAEEEAGRLELLESTVVGKGAALTAGLIVAGAADLALAALVALGLVGGGMPAGGSVALGLAVAAAGWVFAALAAVVAQLSEGARTATALAVGALLVAFLLRAAADGTTGASWLSWGSPLGWSQRVRPFDGDRWLVLALPAVIATACLGVAYRLLGGRDLGAGGMPARVGPATAARGLRGPLGLAWRLQRGLLAAWTVGAAVAGAVLGSVAASLGELARDTPTADMLGRLGGGGGLVDSYLAAMMRLLGLAAAVYAVQATLRLRDEEVAGRTEPLLAGAVGRVRWVAGHLTLALGGTAVVLAAAGLGAGLAHGGRTGDVPGQTARLAGAALVSWPAVAVLAGLALALFGLAPRLTAVSWGLLGGCLFLSELGPLLRLRQWALDLSPFGHLPSLPGGRLAGAPLLWLTVTAAVLTAAGLTGFRRRDLA